MVYGINARQAQGTTFYKEASGCLSVCHENGVLIMNTKTAKIGRGGA